MNDAELSQAENEYRGNLGTGDDEEAAIQAVTGLPQWTDERIFDDLSAYVTGGMIGSAHHHSGPDGGWYGILWRQHPLLRFSREAIIGFLCGIQATTVFIAEKQDTGITAHKMG